MPDSVDRHIEYWRHEVPDLDPALEGVVTRMQVLVRYLQRRKETALAGLGLKSWEYEILWRLRAAGPPYRLAPTRLAEVLGTHPATLTSRLDRLEQAGYVTRVTDPADRRRLLVALASKGKAAWESAIGDQARTEGALLEPLTGTQQAQLAGLLRKVVEAVEADGRPLMAVPSEATSASRRRK